MSLSEKLDRQIAKRAQIKIDYAFWDGDYDPKYTADLGAALTKRAERQIASLIAQIEAERS